MTDKETVKAYMKKCSLEVMESIGTGLLEYTLKKGRRIIARQVVSETKDVYKWGEEMVFKTLAFERKIEGS